ncbi:TPA: hypothetical protein ACS7ZV_003528 [Providencia alcalifaciens]|nr:hypothetical protein [Salmonella enterica]
MKDNRKILTDFLDREKISLLQFTRVVEKLTFRPCSERTVQSWLSSPDVVSSRTCPDWIIELLPEIKKEITK